MNMCKDDGSSADGDVSGFSGLGSTTDAWNAGSCQIQANTLTTPENKSLTQDIIAYLKSPNTTAQNAIYSQISRRGSRTVNMGTLLRVGSPASGGAEVSVVLDSTKPFDLGTLINVKNKRTFAFPQFLMEWVGRQTEEITNALLTPPTLTIIPPTTIGANARVDGSLT
jgi:hypothetical protein